MNSTMSFARKAKYVRMKLKMSQMELSKSLNVSNATIRRWENEDWEPQLAMPEIFYELCEQNGIAFDDDF